MARDFNGTTDRIDYTNVVAMAGNAFTFSVWLFFDSVAVNQYIWGVENAGSFSFIVWTNNLGGSGNIALTRNGSAPLYRLSADGTLSTATWLNLTVTHDGVFTTASSIKIYLNGSEVSYGISQNGGAPENANTGTWTLGGRTADDARNFNGRMAHVGVWNRVITAAEINALAKGYSPLCFRRGLLFAPDLSRLARDNVSNQAGTLDGTAVIDGPPKIVMPRKPVTVRVPFVAPPATFVAAWAHRSNVLIQPMVTA